MCSELFHKRCIWKNWWCVWPYDKWILLTKGHRFNLKEDKHIPISQLISWLLMAWRHQEPWHQQAWYWPNLHGIFHHLLSNSLWPSAAIWWHRPGSTLAQVMAWCHQAASHYLNQCWVTITGVLWHSPQTNFTGSAQNIIKWVLDIHL